MMDGPIQAIRLLLRAIYLLFVLSVIFIVYTLILQYVPASSNEEYESTLIEQKSWKPKSLVTDIPEDAKGEQIRQGYLLITETSKMIGPMADQENNRYAGNNLTCNNCHLNAGRKIGSGSFIGVTNRFPQFRGRENKIGTMEERINGCMERSMDGEALPEDSEEMRAIIAYMKWLSEDVPADIEKLYKGYVKVNIPDYRADTTIGKQLYITKCQHCHAESGEGQKITGDTFKGYVYPPIGGEDSFNDGAGMHRIITAAQFIKGNMPFGATYDSPQLTDEEAYHIAAYISTFPRPSKANKEKDFPDLKLKPMSTAYGPWADNFSPEQHKFGPFPPIYSYYKEKYGLEKNK